MERQPSESSLAGPMQSWAPHAAFLSLPSMHGYEMIIFSSGEHGVDALGSLASVLIESWPANIICQW
jgi:hypothetical protein